VIKFVKSILFLSARQRNFDGMLGTGLPVSMYTMKPSFLKRIRSWELKQSFEYIRRKLKNKQDLKRAGVKLEAQWAAPVSLTFHSALIFIFIIWISSDCDDIDKVL
jgi:hypothetical protein